MFSSRRIDKHLILKDSYHKPKDSCPIGKIFAVILLVFIGIGVVQTARAQSLSLETETRAGAAEVKPEQSKAGQLLFSDDHQTYQQAFHLNSAADISITGMVVSVVMTQEFKNTTTQWQEGVYVFPLPDNTAVSAMDMVIGERHIKGRIKEKDEARKLYTQTKQAGKKAALVEQQRPNLFTQSIANIGPGETIKIILRYQHQVSYDQGLFSLRFPMTLTPRYIPGSPLLDDEISLTVGGHQGWGWALPTDQVKDAQRITPWMMTPNQALPESHNLTLSIHLEAGLPLASINSPYDAIVIKKSGEHHQITTRNPAIPMDHDFVIEWQPVREQAPTAAFFMESLRFEPEGKTLVTDNIARADNTDGSDDDELDHYAMLMLLPPQQETQHQPLPRQAIFIIDTSGSMQGESIVQAKQSLQLALSRLAPQDQFNIIEFNSVHRLLFSSPQAATADNRARAQSFVNGLDADGGTEMAPALQAALLAPSAEGLLKQVVFITDGSVGNEAALFSLIHQSLGQARLFTVGIGAAPNSYFMRKAAEFGRGTFTHIGSTADVAEKMSALFRKLESPVLSDLAIEWPDSLSAEVWPQQLPDLYLGEPLLIHAHFDKAIPPGDHKVIVKGRVAGQAWQRHIQIHQQAPGKSTGIAKLWARAKIAALLDEKIRGRDEAEVRQDVLAVALQHQLLSPYTSLIAIEEVVSKPKSEDSLTQEIPNLVAKGQVPQQPSLVKAASQSLSYPRTATTAPLHLALGFLTLLIYALMNLLMMRREAKVFPHD